MPKIKKKPANQPSSAKKAEKTPGSGNPWAYKECLEPIKEDDALSSNEILNLECGNRYRIRPSVHVTDKQSVNDEVFRMHDPGSRNCAMFVRYICTQYQ